MMLYLSLCSHRQPGPVGAVPVGCGMGVGKPGHPGGWCTAALPPAPFHTGAQHPFCQHLPPMMLFSAAHHPWPPSLLSHPWVYRGLPACAKPCHKHVLPAEARASPIPVGQFGSRQAPMASGSIFPPRDFSLPLLATPCLHPIPLPSLGGLQFWAASIRCLPASSPSCCHGVCSPACIQHAALVSSHTALHHVHCSLTAAICKTAFPPRILTFSPLLFSSLSLSFLCSSLLTALLLTQGKCFFSFPLPALALFSSPSVSPSCLCLLCCRQPQFTVFVSSRN